MNAIIEQCKQALITAGYNNLAIELEQSWRNHRCQDKAMQAAYRERKASVQKSIRTLSEALGAVYVAQDQLKRTTSAPLDMGPKPSKQMTTEQSPSAESATKVYIPGGRLPSQLLRELL